MAFDSAPSPWVLKDIGDRLAKAQAAHDQMGTGGNVYGNPQLQLLNNSQVDALNPELRDRAENLRELDRMTSRRGAFEQANAMDVYDGPDESHLDKLMKMLQEQAREYDYRKRASALGRQ